MSAAAVRSSTAGRRSRPLSQRVFPHVITGVMIALALLWLAPVLWAIDTAVKAEPDTIKIPATWAIPHLTFSAFSTDFSASDIGRWYINSAIVSLLVTVFTVITASMAGYALSRQRFRGQNLLYGAILAGIMIPPQALMVPLFREFQAIHGLNTYWALVLPQVPSPVAVFIFKKFFDGQPPELDQAARMDGASWWTCYRRIALPLSRSAVAAVSIFTFVWTWNNFLWPFLSSTNTPMMTIPVGLGTVIPGEGITNALVMASAILGALPLVVVFLFGQRQIVEGVAGTGLK
ncbi:MAG TPA: carbohydrate ABC transporter permease [Solirubrobacteraceae bacterium]|nr:carbohydrate ABC transporter permease [Solirubrobacteraceae bacterium]